MVDNLVNLFNQLSQSIIKHELKITEVEFENKRKTGVLNNYIKKLRRKCFDLLLRDYNEVDFMDPCKTQYGADWDPSLLLLDYGGELAKCGEEKANSRLKANIQILQTQNYSCVSDMFKLIFMLRDQNTQEYSERNLLDTISEYNFKSCDMGAKVKENLFGLKIKPSTTLCDTPSINLFESGCLLLAELSNKSVSLGSTNKHSFSTSQIFPQTVSSTSNIIIKKKSQSHNNFIDVVNSLCSKKQFLWDNFVDKPMPFKSKCTSILEHTVKLSNETGGSGEHTRNLYKVKEAQNPGKKELDNYWTEVHDNKEFNNFKINEKLDFNVKDLYLFPILRERSLKLQKYESCFGRELKFKKENNPNSIRNSFFQSSPTIILALWEQEILFRYTYDKKQLSDRVVLRILELDQFLRDVQFLLVGVATNTFEINIEKMTFTMKDGTCLEGVTPNTLLSFSREFLDIGSAYVKLMCYINHNLKKQLSSGLKDCRIIFKAFLLTVYEYICRHTQYILKIPLNLGLVEFKAYVKNVYPIIMAVAEVCKVYEPCSILPQGEHLMSYLLHVIQKTNNKFTAGVFFEFLKSCCETYLLQILQDWMFQGKLNRYAKDFFVEYLPKNLRGKNRSYYCSFYYFQDRIPYFLKGLEVKVFNCGKTIHLLKLIQPDSNLCKVLDTRSYPKMKLCLSEVELNEQMNAFDEYKNKISKICGEFVSIESLRRDELAREQEFEKYIVKVKQEQEIERQISKKASIEELRRKREQQNKWLKEQVELAAEEKRKKLEQEELENEIILYQARLISEEEKRILNEEKSNLKMYYEELMEQINNKRPGSVPWKDRSQQLNKRNAAIKTLPKIVEMSTESEKTTKEKKKSDDFTLIDKDFIMDREGNVIRSDALFVEADLDNSNSNISASVLESRMQDIENDNVLIHKESEIQLQKLMSSRKEYENTVNSEGYPIMNDFKQQDNCPLTASQSEGKDIKQPTILTKSDLENLMEITEKSELESQTIENKINNNNYNDQSNNNINNNINNNKETEAQKNKKKIMGSEFGNESIKKNDKEVKFNKSVRETVVQKNRRQIMQSQHHTGIKNLNITAKADVQIPNAKNEALKNKKKVMESEYDIGNKSVVQNLIEPDTCMSKTEAQKNKMKILSSEYNKESKVDDVSMATKQKAYETDAQKNKKKIMDSEFGILTAKEIKTIEGSETKITSETEREKNKKRMMACEFGDSTEFQTSVVIKRVNSAEAQKNKEKYLMTEYGYEIQTDKQKSEDVRKIENEKNEKDERIKKEQGYVSSLNIDDEELESCIAHGVGTGDELSPFMEKALNIFNKRINKFDTFGFFSFKDNSSDERLTNDIVETNCSDVRILFEQHFNRQDTNKDPMVVSSSLDIDVTTFMNFVRQSVLIPLRIQDEIANEALLNHLIEKENMLSHFNALRNYYFLTDGEFSRRLTQNIFLTLAKCTEPQQFFKRYTLNEIVYEALNYSINCNKPTVQNVSFEIVDMPKFLSHSSHDVLAPFRLSYQVKWPLNIIITEKALSKYKEVFHFLLKLKRINWTLNENFSYLKSICKDKQFNYRLLINSSHYHQIHIFRHAMGQFMRTLENYTASCSIQLSWLKFQKDLESAKNLDHIYLKHVSYIKEVTKRCFLTKKDQDLVKCINSLIELSLKFHYVTKSGKWIIKDRKYEHTKFEVLMKTFSEFCLFTTNFVKLLREYLWPIQVEALKKELFVFLDFKSLENIFAEFLCI